MPSRSELLIDCQILLEASERLLAAAGITKMERVLAPIVAKAEQGIGAGFRAQGKTVLKRLEGIKGDWPEPKLEEAITPSEWWYLIELGLADSVGLLRDPIDAAMANALLLGGYSVIAELRLPLTFSLSNPRATAYMVQHGGELITQIDAATRTTINDILVQGSQEGWSYDTTARAITSKFEEFAVGRPQEHIRSRAHLVAVTESSNAYGEGELQQGLEMQGRGMDMEKSWIGAGDACAEICLPNVEEGWIPIDQPFKSGDMRYPGHPACRCGMLQRRVGAVE